MGNWYGGTGKPLTFTVNGDLQVDDLGVLPYAQGNRGRVQAREFCFNPGNPADCLTAWPSAGGSGTLVGIANGGGLTVTNPYGPTTTLAVVDNYVNTTGDTMSGALTINASNTALIVSNTNPGNSGIFVTGHSEGVYAQSSDISGTGVWGVNNTAPSGSGVKGSGYAYGGYFKANGATGTGVYADGGNTGIGMDVLGRYGTAIRTYTYGGTGLLINGSATGVDIGDIYNYGIDISMANTSTGTGLRVSDPNGKVVKLMYHNYGAPNYGLYTNEWIYGGATITSAGSVIADKYCFTGNTGCISWWPSTTPGGSDGAIQVKSGSSFVGDATNFNWDNTNKQLTVTNPYAFAGSYAIQGTGGQYGVKGIGSSYGVTGYSAGYYGVYGYTGTGAGTVGVYGYGGSIGVHGQGDTYGGEFWNNNAAGRKVYLGLNSDRAIYSDGNVYLSGGGTPATYGNLLLPTNGAIGFDGNRDNYAALTYWSDNNFYWDLGTGGSLQIRPGGATAQPYSVTINDGGQIQLNNKTNAGYYFLDRLGTKNWAWYSSGGSAKLWSSTAGDRIEITDTTVNKPSGGSFGVMSDERVKTDIHPLTGALDKLTGLQGVTFQWKHPDEHWNQTGPQGGFIAQDVGKLFPSWITETEAAEKDKTELGGGKAKVVSLPIEFDALVVESIKQLKSENDALKAQNENLEWRLKTLEAKVDSLLTK